LGRLDLSVKVQEEIGKKSDKMQSAEIRLRIL
jgi:hypothetical protein